MYSDLFKTLTEQGEKAFSPITKYNQMVVKNIEETTQLQLTALQNYADAGVEQIKSASEVKDVQGWINFNVKQVEAITSLSQQMIEDGKKLSQISQEFKSQLDEVASETMKKVTPVA